MANDLNAILSLAIRSFAYSLILSCYPIFGYANENIY
jgi:hypothetical protein